MEVWKIKERNCLTPKRKVKLTIAIPASIVAEFKGLREKTEIIGRLARSAAVFRVEEIVIYPNEPNEAQLVKTLLSYVETPRYLRKHIFNVRPGISIRWNPATTQNATSPPRQQSIQPPHRRVS